jgi:fructokinase
MLGGIETGGTWTVCARGTADGTILDRTEFPTTTPARTLERIAHFFREDGELPSAVGVGAFGPLDLALGSPRYGSVMVTPKPGWSGAAIATQLAELLGIPVAIDTDVAAAGLAEQRLGSGRGASSIAYLTVGTGIGAGLLSDGRPWHGLIHPEVGHIRIPHDLQRDPFEGACPLHGDCWEGLASGVALAERWGVDPAELPPGHPAWELEAFYLAAGLLAIVSVASPHRIVIGGGVMRSEGLLQLVRAELDRLNAGYLSAEELSRLDTYLVPAALGDDAGVRGALLLAASECLRT